MQSEAVNGIVGSGPLSAVRPGGIRLRGALAAAACGGVVALAAALRPHAGGFGTHTELGLPGCTFLSRTGYPCPSCGLTTSFAWMARGRVDKAFEAHPFGVAAFLIVAAVALAGAAELAGGRNVLGRIRPRGWWAVAAAAGLFGGWGLKVAWGLAGGTLPLR